MTAFSFWRTGRAGLSTFYDGENVQGSPDRHHRTGDGATGHQRVIAVSGHAGSGKTTLARALARALQLPLLDLDTITNPLLDAVGPLLQGPHWNAPEYHELIRAARYATLRAAAAEIVSVGVGAVLAAPFSDELRGGDAWAALKAATAPALLHVVYIAGPPELLAERRLLRDADRDKLRGNPAPDEEIRIPNIRIDAALTTQQQLLRVLQAIGPRASHIRPD